MCGFADPMNERSVPHFEHTRAVDLMPMLKPDVEVPVMELTLK